MGTKIAEILAILILNFLRCAYSENILYCNVTDVGVCLGKHQKCSEAQQMCVCFDGYFMDGNECVESSSMMAHDATAAVISIFTISLVVVGLILVIRKYSLIDYIQRKINLRRNTDVMYEDVMIGQDDPPLVP